MKADVVVIGGGVIGASIAWRIGQRGRRVVIVDDAREGQASFAAAGMLALAAEAWHGEDHLLALAVESVARYPDFVAELEATTGIDVGYRCNGTLLVALDASDLRQLDNVAAVHEQFGLPSRRLTRRQARQLEPGLHPGVCGALAIEGDHQIDNRQLLAAVRSAAGSLVTDTVVELMTGPEGVTGVRTLMSGEIVASTVVVAAGSWSALVPGLPASARPAVRPVKGQILRLAMDPARPIVERTIRATVHGSSVYLVPRLSGELVIGASVEERGFDAAVTAGAVHELLQNAIDLVPEVRECELVECSVGFRPGSPTNAPHIGRTDVPGLIVATGHYRNGILMTPLTAELVAETVCESADVSRGRP